MMPPRHEIWNRLAFTHTYSHAGLWSWSQTQVEANMFLSYTQESRGPFSTEFGGYFTLNLATKNYFNTIRGKHEYCRKDTIDNSLHTTLPTIIISHKSLFHPTYLQFNSLPGTRTIGVISKVYQASADPKVLAACQALLLGQGP
nr:dynamin-like protein 6 [Tanacetum cinerariifolium]